MDIGKEFCFDSVLVYCNDDNEYIKVPYMCARTHQGCVEVLITKPTLKVFIENPETGELIQVGGPK